MKTPKMPASFNLKTFVAEIYTKNPITGETGWDIEHVAVFGTGYEDARKNLTSYPDFDCVILMGNHAGELSENELKFANQGFKFMKSEYQPL